MTAADVLMEGLIDYAGLFPPAGQDMRTAVESYAAYRAGADRQALGRFILPIARLAEFEETARPLMPRGEASDPWRLSVLVADNARAAGERMLRFNCHHWPGSDDGHAVVDSVELKAATPEDVENQHRDLPSFFQRYFEIPLGRDCHPLIDAIARAGARAKIRTGGVTSDVFPAARNIVAFLAACHEAGVPFKATAGLHHPVRGSYPLTYETNCDSATMYGFLNLFVAAALVGQGAPESMALAALEESDSSAFSFPGDSITWRGHRIEASKLREVRSRFAMSFGSCSFREPVDELARLISADEPNARR